MVMLSPLLAYCEADPAVSGHRWIPLTMEPVHSFDTFIVSPNKLLDKLPVISDAVALMWCHCNGLSQ